MTRAIPVNSSRRPRTTKSGMASSRGLAIPASTPVDHDRERDIRREPQIGYRRRAERERDRHATEDEDPKQGTEEQQQVQVAELFEVRCAIVTGDRSHREHRNEHERRSPSVPHGEAGGANQEHRNEAGHEACRSDR